MAESKAMKAEVLTPEGAIFDDEAYQVSVRTTVGELGIRARHAPVLARIEPCLLRVYASESDFDGDGERWAIAEGWLEVFANRTRVLVGEAHEVDSLDSAELKSKLEDASQRMEEAEEGSATYVTAERDKARAEAFVELAEG